MQRIVAVGLACLVAALGLAGEPPKDTPKDKAPAKPKLEKLEIWAERIQYAGRDGKFRFIGDVTVIKGTLRVDCERMDGEVDAKTRRITKVTAVGDVRMVNIGGMKPDPKGARPPLPKLTDDDWMATCAQADYDLKSGRVKMAGKYKGNRPQLRQGKNYAEADTISFVPETTDCTLDGNPVIHGDIPTGPGPKKPGAAAEPAPKKKAGS